MKRIPSVAVEFLEIPFELGTLLNEKGFSLETKEPHNEQYVNEDKSIYILYHWLRDKITLEDLYGVVAILPKNGESEKKALDLGQELQKMYGGILYPDPSKFYYDNPYDGVFKILGDEE